ncbi:hypothetical protein CU669_14315 [Paramagnetospirillum kuznetsovii]|uniref:Hemerythrin-like domain-containing protein n=1 Tax=Paramagnetospirillum kuznetsovii TaxID=2053833 RepID=A0A364NW74_9PROT|nr:hemerythrin family protein [Paramagnetospirillum kuznetsovii]RAU21339.1 hypothetical protein CU669_14315 [Paramagnetospirillum kuznetsovii]
MAQLAQEGRTGVPAIDAAHDGLRFLLERVFEPGVECRRGAVGKGECDRVRCLRIDAILRYVQRNFSTQEQVMAEAAYPEAQRHQDDHASLVDKLTIMRDGHVCADKDSLKVHDFIAHWAGEHAKRCDQPLGRWAVTRRLVDPTG